MFDMLNLYAAKWLTVPASAALAHLVTDHAADGCAAHRAQHAAARGGRTAHCSDARAYDRALFGIRHAVERRAAGARQTKCCQSDPSSLHSASPGVVREYCRTRKTQSSGPKNP